MATGKSTLQFAKEVIDLTGGRYRLESTYINARTPVKIKHLSCGTVFTMKPNSFLNGQRCSNDNCKKARTDYTLRKKSYNKLLEYIKLYPEYILLTSFSQYKGADSYVRMYHTVCGSYYNVTPHAFERGRRCPQCANISRRIKHQKKNALAIMQNKLGKDYIVETGKYENKNQNILIKHLTCGHCYSRKASTVLLNCGKCPYCYEKRGISYCSLLRLLKERHCKLLSIKKDFYYSKDFVDVEHLDCGQQLRIQVNRLKFPRSKNGIICKYCNRKYLSEIKMKSNNDFLKEFNKRLDSNEYVILTEYIGAHNKVKVKHLLCESIFNMEANNLLKGYSCPVCSHSGKSVGETLVAKYLDKYNISYEYPKSFNDLVDSKPLRYDFYLPTHNTLIEYQGKQHYYPLSYFGGEKSFNKQVKHDRMKRDYAIKNGFNFVEIPYRESYTDKMSEIESRLSFIIN